MHRRLFRGLSRLLISFSIVCSLVFTLGVSSVLLADGNSGSSSSSAGYAQSLPPEIPALVDKQYYNEAIDALNTFIREESRNADAWNLLGYSLRKVELYDDSLKAYKKALKLDKKHLGAREYIGELYLTLGKPRKARKELKKLEKYCGNCEQYINLSEAIKAYEENS